MATRSPTTQTIVLVDDDAALRMALTFVLELDGFVVQALESGEALLTHPLPSTPACLVLDQNLGGIGGIEALSQLRTRGVSIPALLITSHPRPGYQAAASGLGAVIVEKPLLGDTLLRQIQAAFEDELGPDL